MNGESSVRRRQRPNIIVELVAGGVVGLLLGGIGGLVGGWLGQGGASGWGDLVGALLGTFVGYIAGTTLGVSAAAMYVHRPGSPALALLGSLLAGILIVLLAEPLGLNQQPFILQLALVIGPLLGALGGYHMRKGKPTLESS